MSVEKRADWARVNADIFIGQPPGMAYAVTRRTLEEKFKGDVANVPMPKCAHLLAFDKMTDNYIVARLPDGLDDLQAQQEVAKFLAILPIEIVHVNRGAA